MWKRSMVTPYREVIHSNDEGFIEAPDIGGDLGVGQITTLPMANQEKARIRRRRKRRFGFQQR